ncbi:biopolymer transporter ExbD [Haliangium ochraceum]|uniref:Biopolymer transport protein ExbD/TolR n=1 Tax=Haliangium ochraceum (strain DSM 14365 / JCM 11303 / SMP-2) TaxID=502025 RepID=D0LV51_HALO1|nr:biopolymer transporter ExbD [Haliangium ochraceum]ACY15892.1 Biopolymer transport protein ExbD/TolR [Haliangium ochraceum DSM 14365]
MISAREARAIVRKAIKRVPEGEEIRHLNIMPMMDIMTILLVAFIFQAAVGAAAVTAASVDLPSSVSQEPMPEAASIVIVSPEAISVEDQQIVPLHGGEVDPSLKEGGALGVAIPKLTKFLAAWRQSNEAEMRAKGKTVPDIPELMIIADRSVPYRLLYQVIYSAKQKEAGYKRFRLIVLKYEPGMAR